MKKCSNKNCTLNGVIQPLENFRRCSAKKDGRKTICKTCETSYSRKHSAAKKDDWVRMWIG